MKFVNDAISQLRDYLPVNFGASTFDHDVKELIKKVSSGNELTKEEKKLREEQTYMKTMM